MTKRRNRDADNLSFRLDKAADWIPEIRQHLDEQRWLAATSSGHGEGRQGGTHSDPTGRAVTTLDGIERYWDAVTRALLDVGEKVDALDDACRAALGVRAHRAERSTTEPRPSDGEPKCQGGDEPWGDDTCGALLHWDVVDGHVSYEPSGLCPRHLIAFTEWRRNEDERRQRAEESNARRLRRHREGDAA